MGSEDEMGLVWSPLEVLAKATAAGDRPVVLTVRDGVVSTVTGDDLVGLIRGVAALLDGLGIGAGDPVAIWAPNSPQWIAAGLACHLLGVVLAPIDAVLPEQEAMAQVEGSGARAIFLAREGAAKVPPGVKVLALEGLQRSTRPMPEIDLAPDVPIALFHTSGTTGAPKKFHLSLGSVGWNVRAISDSGFVRPTSRVLLPLPLHHVFPWITAALSSLTVGAVLILPQGPTGRHVAEAMHLTRPSILIGVPRLFEAMLAGIRTRLRAEGAALALGFESLLWLSLRLTPVTGGLAGRVLMVPFRRRIAPGLRIMVSGGAHLSRRVEDELTALGWDARGGYGMAETAASVAAPLRRRRAGSNGQAIPGCEIRIDRPNEDGIGEILLKGPVVFSGYLDDPTANATAFTRDGFFRSGDLGWLDKDGFLYVTGRAKEVIVLSGGDNLNPEDIEDRYLASPVIAEIGVLERDGALVAVIVPDMFEIARIQVANPAHAVSIAVATIARDLPSTWRISAFVLSNEPMERTRLMKLRRFLLPDLYDRLRARGTSSTSSELSEQDAAWIAQPPRDAVWRVLEQEYPGRPYTLDGFVGYDLGLDSFGWMNLALAIENATGVRLSGSDIAGIMTLRDLMRLVSERHGAGVCEQASDAGLAIDAAKWLAPHSLRERILGALLYRSDAVLMRTYFRLRVEGRENLGAVRDCPVILCPNHSSILDSLAVAAACPPRMRRRLRWSGSRARTFDTWLRRAIARPAGMLPVDEADPMAAIGLGVASLNHGMAQVWYPEGWLTPDGKLLPFQVGVGHVILQSRAPVIPVVIDGTFAAMPRDARLARPRRVRVIFGPPLAADDLIKGAGSADDRAQHIAARIERELLSLAAAHGLDLERKEPLV